MSFVEELRWRGMLHDITPGAEELLIKENVSGYIGFDPTSDSLHIGSLAQIMFLTHFQQFGHTPVALVGGATGMVGDPSGKSAERNLLDIDTLNHYADCIRKQLERFLDFDAKDNPAKLVNNYDWFKDMSFLDFIRDVGKHITVNYMMAKDSVKNRLENGMSFTEFSYQLVQGYDFYYLNQHHNCKLQMGGSDQWGNIVTGTELIRRKSGNEAYAITCPLIKKADGGKFGKTESGNVWLDPNKTSPYKFYQFWLNVSDEDVAKYIRVFTVKSKDEIEALEKEHAQEPHLRILQKELAKDITIRVHSEEDYKKSVAASNILFGKTTKDALSELDENTFLDVFEGVPQSSIAKSTLERTVSVLDFLTDHTEILASKGEARRTIQGGGLSINKEKITTLEATVSIDDLLNEKYVLVQKGKKNYFLVTAE